MHLRNGKIVDLVKEDENKRAMSRILFDRKVMDKVMNAIADDLNDDDFEELDKIKIVRSKGLDRDKIYELFSTNNSNIMLGYTAETDDFPEGFVIKVRVGSNWKSYHFDMKGKLMATD